MLQTVIDKLVEQKNLTKQESAAVIQEILQYPFQISAFLALMRAKGETTEEIAGIVETMRSFMHPVRCKTPVLDIVGTGGDGAHTVNISTGSAILAATCGVKIAKHGNRSVSSLCGAADVLEVLGIKIEVSPEEVAAAIEKVGIGFMFAPLFHPAMQQLALIRKGLKMRTVFNMIGPLLNPAGAEYQMIGVFRPEILELMASSLFQLGTKRSLVFHGTGLDELSCVGPAEAIEVTPQGMQRVVIDPQKLGLKRCNVEDLKGGDARHNADLLLRTFEGEQGAIADTLALNAGIALTLYGITTSFEEGIAFAQEKLKERACLKLLKEWKECL